MSLSHRFHSEERAASVAPSSEAASEQPAPAAVRTMATVILATTLSALIALSARSASSQSPPSEPFALQHVATLGSTDTPWLRSNAYLNQPWGLGADRDGIWDRAGGGAGPGR